MLVEAGFLLSPPPLRSPYSQPLLPLLRRELLSLSLKCVHTNPTPNMPKEAFWKVSGGQQGGAGTGHLPDLPIPCLCPQFLLGPAVCSQPHQSTGFCQTPIPPFSSQCTEHWGQRESRNGLWKVLETYASILWPLCPAQGLIWSPYPGETPMPSWPRVTSSQVAAQTQSWVCPTAKPGKSSKGCARSTGTVCPPLCQQPTCCSAPCLRAGSAGRSS